MGLSLGQISLFISAIWLGAIVLQYPLGWLSDRMDRRVLIVATRRVASPSHAPTLRRSSSAWRPTAIFSSSPPDALNGPVLRLGRGARHGLSTGRRSGGRVARVPAEAMISLENQRVAFVAVARA